MSTYADMENTTCMNVIVAEPTLVAVWPTMFPGHTLVGPIDALSPMPGIGWTYDGTTWTPPPEEDTNGDGT